MNRNTKARSKAVAKTPAQKQREKVQLQKQREKVKQLEKKLVAERKVLDKMSPARHVKGLVRQAKKVVDQTLQKASSVAPTGRKTSVPVMPDRTVKPLEFIDGLCSFKSYLIVSHKSTNKNIRLGVRFTGGEYRMHFYPSIAAHDLSASDHTQRKTLKRTGKGYETVWVDKATYESILNALRSRRDTHNLPQDLVEKLVRARDQSSVEQALASVG